jgi:hypothetical protein
MLDMMETMKEEAKQLNTTINDPHQKRLEHLHTEKIGGILVVTRIDDANGAGTPFLTLLVAPSVVATYKNATTGDIEVIFDNIWDALVLGASEPILDTMEVHCPVIGAQEEFSQSSKLDPKVFSLLQDSQSLLLPTEELTCATVTQGENTPLDNFPCGGLQLANWNVLAC